VKSEKPIIKRMKMKNLEAKEERKSNGGQHTDSNDDSLGVEIESGGDAVKEQNGVDDHEEPGLLGGFASENGGELEKRRRRTCGRA